MADAKQYRKLKSALGPADDCPPLPELACALDAGEADERRRAAEAHLARCVRCRDELALSREFVDAQIQPDETKDVRWIVRQLEKQETVPPTRRRPLSLFFGMRALLTAACLLIVAAGALYYRRGPGGPSAVGVDGVMRSQGVELIAPVGDVRQTPVEFRWQAAARAARYQVRLTEVDGHEVWRGYADQNFTAAPPAAIALMLPGRTLLWDVTASDAAGKIIAVSATRSFRIVVDSR